MNTKIGLAKSLRAYRKKFRIKTAISLVLSILGAVLMLYPVGATFYNNVELTRQSDEYNELIGGISVEENDASIDSAREYNDWLSKNRFTPPPIGKDKTHSGYGRYEQHLMEGHNSQMAQIIIPEVDINLPIFHGTSNEVLYKGAGHLYGTHLPVGGESTTTAISAHTGMATASMFDNLSDMEIGDSAFIKVRGETLHYTMRESEIVAPDSLDAIKFEEGNQLLQLITCTPYGINSDRLVVTMERSSLPDPIPDLSIVSNPTGISGWQWWMTLTTMMSALFVIGFITSFIFDLRKKKKIETRTMGRIAHM